MPLIPWLLFNARVFRRRFSGEGWFARGSISDAGGDMGGNVQRPAKTGARIEDMTMGNQHVVPHVLLSSPELHDERSSSQTEVRATIPADAVDLSATRVARPVRWMGTRGGPCRWPESF